MIMVEVFIPVFDTAYDFKIDEYASVNMIIDEIAEMVCRYEHCALTEDTGEFVLCDMDNTVVLEKNKNLIDYGIQNGARLILV